jgi:hypothetical protein
MRRVRWVVYIVCIWEMKSAYRIFVGNPEGKRPLRKHRHKWENNSKMYPKERCGKVWTGLIWLWIGSGGGLL